jgi:hypothetical protein
LVTTVRSMNTTPGWLVVHHHSQQPVTFVVEEDGSGLETQYLGAVREFFEPGMRAQRIQPGMARESIVAAVSLVDCQGQQLQRTFGLVQSRLTGCPFSDPAAAHSAD